MLLAALALAGLTAGEPAPLPDGNTYVLTLVEKQKRREAALNNYTYDVEQLLEELDARGAVTSRTVERFEVFYVKGRPVRKLVATGGRPLDRAEQEAEERRVREKVDELGKDPSALDDPALRLSAILQRYDFRTVRREDLDGWPALVLEFSARPGKRDLEGDVVLRSLAGRIWVDEAEAEVVRAEVRNTGAIKLAFGVGATVSGLGVTLDFRKVEDGLWLPARVTAEAEARLLLLKGFRGRSTSIFSHYRRFEAASEEVIKRPE
jgi:hypothetical protein